MKFDENDLLIIKISMTIKFHKKIICLTLEMNGSSSSLRDMIILLEPRLKVMAQGALINNAC